MLNLLIIALFQFASFSSSATQQMPAQQPLGLEMSRAAQGGVGGWGGDLAAQGGVGGWGGDLAAQGGVGGWGGDIASQGGVGGWGGDIAA